MNRRKGPKTAPPTMNPAPKAVESQTFDNYDGGDGIGDIAMEDGVPGTGVQPPEDQKGIFPMTTPFHLIRALLGSRMLVCCEQSCKTGSFVRAILPKKSSQ